MGYIDSLPYHHNFSVNPKLFYKIALQKKKSQEIYVTLYYPIANFPEYLLSFHFTKSHI